MTVAGVALDAVLLDNVYETLLKLDDEGEIGPGLAALPEVSADGTVYTFTLQDGVTFHSGEPLTSADVVWSLDSAAGRGRQRGAPGWPASPPSRRPTTRPSSSRCPSPTTTSRS